MKRYAAFLRGINLGGRRIKNEALRSHAEELGFEEVSTFRASGNLIFAAEGAEAAVGKRLEEGLGEALGYEVPVYLRDEAELLAIASRRPFTAKQQSGSKGKLQIALLRRRPSSAARDKALALATEDDRLAVEGRELFWLPRGGMAESDLDLKAVAATLGPTTIRTMGTIEQIASRHFGD